MGCGQFRRRRHHTVEDIQGSGRSRQMDRSSWSRYAGSRSERDSSGQSDIAAILSYLIRSGQVNNIMLSSDRRMNDDDDDLMDDDDDDGDGGVIPYVIPQVDKCPDTSVIDTSELKIDIQQISGQIGQKGQKARTKTCMSHLIQQREHGLMGKNNFSPVDRCVLNCNFLPNKSETVAKLHSKAFCGTFSQSGDIFMSACQDRFIRIYDTVRGNFKLFRSIQALDVGWSVLDTAFSPDGNYLVYSSWSNYLHLCNIYGEHQTHSALYLDPETEHSFCIFSVAFSQDNKEIMGGANDRCLYVFDRELNKRTLRIEAHEDDVNAVAFADETSHILFSGSDDGLCKIWDRRTLREDDPKPIGVLAGHHDGITFIDSKLDGRYLISNCKDQTIKLWDIRHLSSKQVQEATRREVSRQNWDYRWQQVPHKVTAQKKKIPGDSSLMTYRGHCVLNTLVRCRFSPLACTGQRYIYTGCATGAVIVYDILTGQLVTKLMGHKQCVRDVSWHPYENIIMSTSWDSTVARWAYKNDDDETEESKVDSKAKEDPSTKRSAKHSYNLRNCSM